MRSLQMQARTLLEAEGGVSAIEFALLAPVFVFSLLSAVDLGFAAFERMTIDHVLRAGAQSAMSGQDLDDVQKVLETTRAKNFGDTAPLAVAAVKICACPEAPSASVACLTVCAGSAPPSVFINLSASKTYNSIFLPNMTLSPSKQVQVR